MTTPQKPIVFRRWNALGKAPAQKLFDLVAIQRVNGNGVPARVYTDYSVVVLKKSETPEGVELIERV